MRKAALTGGLFLCVRCGAFSAWVRRARLKRNIGLEIALAAGIVARPHAPRPGEVPDAHAPPGRAFASVESDGATLLVEVTPGKRGENRLTSRMTGADGRPFSRVNRPWR